MKKTIEYRVLIDWRDVDDCGNQIIPPSDGEIRRMLEKINRIDEVNVERIGG